MERRLAAIMATDVVGYSRLIPGPVGQGGQVHLGLREVYGGDQRGLALRLQRP